jgi:hypothetical protein
MSGSTCDNCHRLRGPGFPSPGVGESASRKHHERRSASDVRPVIVVCRHATFAKIGATPVNGQTVSATEVSVGWLYVDNQGALWFQQDPLGAWTSSINVNFNQYFGISITPPPGKTPTYIGVPQNGSPVANPNSTPISNNLIITKCFQKGSGLVPGALG